MKRQKTIMDVALYQINILLLFIIIITSAASSQFRRAQWLRGRPPDSRLREPGFESCAAVLKSWASFFHSTLLQFTQLYK